MSKNVDLNMNRVSISTNHYRKHMLDHLLSLVVGVFLRLSPFLILADSIWREGWPHRLLSLIIIVASLCALHLDKRVSRKLQFYLLVFLYPVFAPFYCILLGGDLYSLNNTWLQFSAPLNNQALFYVAIVIYCLCFAIKRNIRAFSDSIDVCVMDKYSNLFLYVLSITLFVLFFYLTEPGDTLFSVDYSTLMQQRIEGTQFAGGVGAIFFVMSSIWYSGRSHRHNKYWLLADRYFIVSSLFSLLWLLLHGRRTVSIGILALYLFIIENNFKRRLILGFLGLLAMVVIGSVRDNVLSMSSLISAIFYDNAGALGTYRKVALPGGGSNVYLTLLDTMHYVGENGIHWGSSLIDNLLGFIPTFILTEYNIVPTYFSDILSGSYDYNGGLYYPAIFYLNFGFIGVICVFASLFYILKLICLSSTSKKFSLRVCGLTLFFFSARFLWYEPIGSLKFAVYGYLLGLIVEKVSSTQHNLHVLPSTITSSNTL